MESANKKTARKLTTIFFYFPDIDFPNNNKKRFKKREKSMRKKDPTKRKNQ
jgi:hypothetical protein